VSPVLLWCVLRINAQTTLQELWDGPGMALEALFQLAEDTGEISFRHDRSFVSETLSGGRGIFAREKLNVDDEVLSVALNGENRLYISMEDVVRSPLGASSYLRENLSPNGMLALFLCIHATFGSDSEWHAYLSSLPGFEDALDSEVSSVAELRRVQERRWQNSSSFGSVLQKRLDAVEAEWEVVQNALFGEDDAVDTDTVEMRPLLSASKISLGFFHWALRIVFSRLHSIQVLVPDDSEEEMWKTRAVLLPIADLFNFGPARSKSSAGAEDVLQSKSANVECFTTDDGERYTCVANTKVLPGEELFVDYSRRELNSFQLMLDYGFALPSTLLSGGREMRTLMYNASVAQVPFFAVEDYEASQGLREEKTKLLRTVFGDSFDAFMDQGVLLQRTDIADVESFLGSPLMIVARIYALSVNEIREARTLKINNKFMVEVSLLHALLVRQMKLTNENALSHRREGPQGRQACVPEDGEESPGHAAEPNRRASRRRDVEHCSAGESGHPSAIRRKY